MMAEVVFYNPLNSIYLIMEILLTPDQESTLRAIGSIMEVYGEGHWIYFPFYLKSKGGGVYDSLRFDQLPESVKDALLANQGIKLPTK